jgi:aminomethyltransferase
MGAVAVQGPAVAQFVDQLFPGESAEGKRVAAVTELKKNEIGLWVSGEDVWVSRTGYTGEDGFEIIAPAGTIENIWDQLLRLGEPYGLVPCGLGARDTLRTEVCYPLYGHELDEQTTPIEAGLGFFVALEKGDFIGRSVLAAQKAEGVSKRCIAFTLIDKSAPPRPHYPIWSAGVHSRRIGAITSGTLSPFLGMGIGMGYVPPDFAKSGTAIEIEIRGKRAPALVVSKPIYKKPK